MTSRRGRAVRFGTAGLAMVALLGTGGAVWANEHGSPTAAAPAAASVAPVVTGLSGNTGVGLGSRRVYPGTGSAGRGAAPGGSTSDGSTSSGNTSDGNSADGNSADGATSGAAVPAVSTPTQASAEQTVGVVDIVSELDYGQAEAAGTGIVLTSTGTILTNNHVIDSATSIKVTVISTGLTYTATVVGTSPTNDIAVLRLTGAPALATARLGSSAEVAVGDAVAGVGNAGNLPGTAAANGTVTALDQSITASDDSGSNTEALSGLIETNADIQAGDSGGPLYGTAGTVIGIDTAASTSGRAGTTTAGYAIPISHALAVASQITSGVSSSAIHQGVPAFLGIEEADGISRTGVSGVTISGVVPGSAAAALGLAAGDTITALGGHTVANAADLQTVIGASRVGSRLSIAWSDAAGTARRATVTLGAGPAD